MAEDAGAGLLGPVLVFLAAAIIAVPLFRRLGLGSILGYLAGGTVIGPFGLGLIGEVESVMRVAELGIVLLLFVIGLELRPSRLWSMRRDIFGLGLAQVAITGLILAGAAVASGFDLRVAVVSGLGLALSSTAFVLQMLRERGELNTGFGARAFAILLFQDISIVPLLAIVPLLGQAGGGAAALDPLGFAIALAAIAGVVLAGRFALNPLFRLLAESGAQEIMTAAALLVVIGAAAAMAAVGMSMALGAFIAGVLLADSSYRHQLEGDIEPFRGLLLGLFFIAVGMAVDWRLVAASWREMAALVVVFMAVKAAVLFVLARISGSSAAEAVRIAAALPQGGEFAFVVFAFAAAEGVLAHETSNLLIAAVTLSMALTPAIALARDRVAAGAGFAQAHPEAAADVFEGNERRVILIGFGRFGQIVAGMLHVNGCGLTAIDNNPRRIRAAESYGYKVYFGDAARASVLRAAGADEAQLVVLCINNRAAINKAIEIIRAEFPNTAIYARASDRAHAIELMERDVDFQVRETLESAILLGREAMMLLGADPNEAEDCETEFRRLDRERLLLEQGQGPEAGYHLMPHRRPPRARREAAGDGDKAAE